MKPYLYTLLAAASAAGLAQAQTAYTTPVGYVTKTLGANQFNLVGLTLHQPTAAAGILDASSSSTVTDNNIDFSTALTAGATYVLELSNGTIQEISAWSGSVLTTPDDISSLVTAGQTSYKIRKASTISDVFGVNNSAGLTASADGSLTGVDLVLILNSSGSFDTVFYVNDGAGTEGWFDVSFNPAADKPIVYADAFFVQKAASSGTLTITGEVKTAPTSGVLNPGWNYVGGAAPAGLTVDGTGLKSFLTPTPDGDLTNADTLLLPNPDGTYKTLFYVNDGAGTEGWFDDGFNEASAVPFDSGVLIFNKGSQKGFTIGVPDSFSGL
ncbi:MAG: hypothetical protein ACO3JG_10420 [Luteolibacter sp.]